MGWRQRSRNEWQRLVAGPPVSGYLSCPLIPHLKSLGGDRSV
jgi:hypothetical protein